MTTQLTVPVAKNATQATVDSWHLELSRDPVSLAPQTDQSSFTATVTLRYADGSVSSKTVFGLALNALPAGALAAIRAFHLQVIGYLRNQGVLPAGTDVADI